MKRLNILLLALLCTGCSTSLKSSWQDFRAYYNTFYNARESYNSGMNDLGTYRFDLTTEDWVRIHPSRFSEGQPDFQKAIEKSSRVVQEFPRSRWADEAVFIMARSRYHRKELFQALSDFEELYRRTPEKRLRQEAVLWKARVLFDLQRHSDAVGYLEDRMDELTAEEGRNYRAEAKAIQAEHYCRLQELEAARDLLSQATSELQEGDVKSRAHFLFGQVLEQIGSYRQAFFAYANVAQGFPDYEYIFWSEIKRAQVARQMGEAEEAMQILNDLRSDDKNYSDLHHILYEIGRTREHQQQFEGAERIYRELLYGQQRANAEPVRSKTYYRLGIIYSEHLQDYPLAAAWFDSSSAGGQPERLAVDMQAEPVAMAAAYRTYTDLKNEHRHLDSLLWLGSLPEQQRDSVLKVVHDRQLERMKEENNRQQDLLFNDNRPGPVEQSPLFGFLNHRNGGMVRESRNRFRAYWGERPLTDNWRREEAVRSSGYSGGTDTGGPATGESAIGLSGAGQEEIPKTPEERDILRERVAEIGYELGNLFFLNLGMPDSARKYFHRLDRDHPEAEITPLALYSLYELYLRQGETDSARAVKNRLLTRYGTETLDPRILRNLSPETGGIQTLGEKYRVAAADSSLSGIPRARRFRKLALAETGAPQAPAIHFQALEIYIREAKGAAEPLPDSLRPAGLQRPLFAGDSADSLGQGSENRYRGGYWDTVRVMLEEFEDFFPEAPESRRVALLREELRLSDISAGMFVPCEESGGQLTVRGGITRFMERVELPEIPDMQLDGEITYRFKVDTEGTVQSWELVTPRTGLGIEEALEKAFRDHLQFDAVQREGKPAAVACNYSFPVTL